MRYKLAMPRNIPGHKVTCFHSPPDVHNAIRVLAAADGETVNDWIVGRLSEVIRARGDSISLLPKDRKGRDDPGDPDDYATITDLIGDNLAALTETRISNERLRDLAAGHKPDIRDLNRIAECLDMDVDRLETLTHKTFNGCGDECNAGI